MSDVREPYQGQRALVTGATGFIGSQVARGLVAAGAELHVAVRSETAEDRIQNDGIVATVHHADLVDGNEVEALVAQVAPNVVFNLAGYGVRRHEVDPEMAERINAALPAALGRAIARIGSPLGTLPRLIHTGSAAEYGAAGGNLAEDGPTEPLSLYGRTKLDGTRRLVQEALSGTGVGVVARLFTVFGPGEPGGRLLPTLLTAAVSGDPVPLTDGQQERDFTYVGDVVDGLLRAGRAPIRAGMVFNLATGRLASVRTFVRRAAGVLGIPESRLRFGALEARPDEMAHGPVTIERCRALLNWVPEISIEEGVRRTRAMRN